MKVNLSPNTARMVIEGLLGGSDALGFEADLPDGLDIDITNEVIQQHVDRNGPSWHVAPKRITIRWHYAVSS